MRAVGVLLLAALTANVPVLSERPAAVRTEARVEGRDAVIESLVVDARAVPPEFSADVLLRLTGSSRILDTEWRRELIEEAYLRAYSAWDAYRVSATSTSPNSRQGAQVIASDTALTRVSLQLRAAQLMASVDPVRAREMFEWIDLDLVAGTCDSPLVPAVDEYYTTLAVLARQTFGQDAQGRSDALRFMTLYLFQAHLPTDMPAVARALRTFRPTTDEAVYLEGTFRWILDSSLRDPRGFSSISIDLVTQFMALEDADRTLGLTNWTVTRALRDYLVTQFKGPRCSDSLSDGTAVDTFNAALRRREIAPETIRPLAPGDTRPSSMLGAARMDAYWRTIEARRLYDMGVRLRGPDRRPVSDQVRMSEGWLMQAEQLLTSLERWTGSREALERDYVYQKSVLYTLLADLVPPTPLRARTLRSFADFLKNADRDRAGRTLWFAFANRLIELTRSADRALVLDLLEHSGHPVLALYGRVERTLGTSRRPSDF
jgi:hypothetical protein